MFWREITEAILVQILSFCIDAWGNITEQLGKSSRTFLLGKQGYQSNNNLVRVNYKEILFVTAESILTSLWIFKKTLAVMCLALSGPQSLAQGMRGGGIKLTAVPIIFTNLLFRNC